MRSSPKYVLLCAALLALILGACSNYMTMTRQSCQATMDTINCSGRVGGLYGAQSLVFYDEDSVTSLRSNNWNAAISMSIEEGELVVEITNLDEQVERFTVTPDTPLEVSVAVNRSLTGRISARLAAQGEGEETPVVRGINWEASFTAR